MGVVSPLLSKIEAVNHGFFIFSAEGVVRHTSQIIILLCLFSIILLIGMITRWYFIKYMILLGEKILQRLPLVNKIYKGIKDIVTNLFGQGKNSFKQVVAVPFPAKGMYALGFLSEKAPRTCSSVMNAEMISVFVPTAPNPATGFILMFKADEVQFLDMQPEDAIKYIVSCGLVTPHHEDENG